MATTPSVEDGCGRTRLPQASAPALSGIVGDTAPAAEEDEIALHALYRWPNHVQYDIVHEEYGMIQTHTTRFTSLEQSSHAFPVSPNTTRMVPLDIERGNAVHVSLPYRGGDCPWQDATTQYG